MRACTAGDYSRHGRLVLANLATRGTLPIIAGGTGLYLRALLDGLFPAPPRNPELRTLLRDRAARRGAVHLHRTLARLDPKAAALIHTNDVPKVVRAIEISLSARTPMTQQWQQGRDALTGYSILRLGLDPPRTELYARIDQRAATMFREGAGRGNPRIDRPLRRWVSALHVARLFAGVGCTRRLAHAGASPCRRTARPSQLRQTPDDVVPPARQNCIWCIGCPERATHQRFLRKQRLWLSRTCQASRAKRFTINLMSSSVTARPQLAHLTAQLDDLKARGTFFKLRNSTTLRRRSAPTTDARSSTSPATTISACVTTQARRGGYPRHQRAWRRVGRGPHHRRNHAHSHGA